MTKYKEYLKAHGIKVQCDYEAEYCHGVDAIDTTVLNNGIVVGVHHTSMGYCYTSCDRSGAWSYFCDFDLGMHLEELCCDVDYIDWLYDMHCNESDVVYDTMRQMYQDDEKVRIAFKHMKAGIMDFFAFYEWISDRYQKLTRFPAHS